MEQAVKSLPKFKINDIFNLGQRAKDQIFERMMEIYTLTPVEEFVLRRKLSQQEMPPELEEKFGELADGPYNAAWKLVRDKLASLAKKR